MPQIVSIHSYRGGTGKSNTTANIAALLAAEGRRVGVVDTDIQSPGIHILFGLEEAAMHHSLNDYLWGNCHIKETAHDVTPRLGGNISGRIFLIPSSMKAGDIARVLREGYDVGVLRDGLHELIEALNLDVLMIDTHPGLNEETLLSIAISDALAIVLRPDQQDYQGTSVTVEVARKLDVPGLVYGFLDHPFFTASIYLLFLVNLFLHGLFIYQNPWARGSALVFGLLVITSSVVMVRRGVFGRRTVVELREDKREGGRGVFALTSGGQPVTVAPHEQRPRGPCVGRPCLVDPTRPAV